MYAQMNNNTMHGIYVPRYLDYSNFRYEVLLIVQQNWLVFRMRVVMATEQGQWIWVGRFRHLPTQFLEK